MAPLFLVLRMRLELIHLSAPPPQDGMSTNFTTAAGFFNYLAEAAAAGLTFLFLALNVRLLLLTPNEPFLVFPFLDLISPFPMVIFMRCEYIYHWYTRQIL